MQTEMDYSPGIWFETGLVNVEESKLLTKNNQPEDSNPKQQKRCWCSSINHLQITSKCCYVVIAMEKSKNWTWGWEYLNLRQRS